jgi:S1-C subfamily serine protease
MTGLDWVIVVFALAMGFWGYQQGLIVGVLTLSGFAIGAFLGSRLGPALLPDGSHSPYAPATALAGALLIGGMAAVLLEGVALALRRRLLGTVPGGGVAAAEGVGGAILLVGLALGLAWLFGAVALNAPGARDFRKAVQRSAILKALNDAFPPSNSLINALHRIDPRVAVQGPSPDVAPPDSKVAEDPEVVAAGEGVVRVLGTACGLGVEGSGWIAAPGIVVTNAHVVAGESDTTVTPFGSSSALDASAVHYDPSNDLAILRVSGLEGRPLSVAPEVRSGAPGAVLGYPENGPFTITPARVGMTGPVVTEDSYGRGPITRELTGLRGQVRSGNSGGPLVDTAGRVLGTIFASTTQGKPGGYAVPNEVVEQALSDTTGEVGTGACTG